MDALLAHGLSQPGDLEVVAADINPRVVAHIRRSHNEPPTLTLVSEIRDSETVTLSDDYRDYFARLGRAIGEVTKGAAAQSTAAGQLRKTVRLPSRSCARVPCARARGGLPAERGRTRRPRA